MRLSKTAWLVLGIGIFVIVAATLGWLYFRESGQQRELDDSLAAAEATLPPLVSEKEDWESQLTQIESQLARATALLNIARSSFPASVDSIDVDERLFQIADSLELEIVSLSSSEATEEMVEDVAYSVTPFTVTVEGKKIAEPGFATQAAYKEYIDRTVANLVGYVSTIATDTYFGTATIELLSMSVPALPTDEQLESQGAGVGRPSVSIKLVIYSYQGEGE